MNFREFLTFREVSLMNVGQKPNSPTQLKAGPQASEFSPGEKYLPAKSKKKPPGAGNYDYPVKPLQAGWMGAGKLIPTPPPSPFGNGGPTPNTPKVPPLPPSPVPKQMRAKK